MVPESEKTIGGAALVALEDLSPIEVEEFSAGFTETTFRRCDPSIRIGRDLDEAVAFNLAIGPAADVVRLAGAEATEIRPRLEASLREALARFETPDGLLAASSTWIVTSRVPLI